MAVRSALSQSWRTIEVIVVDDGSTDATPEVAAEYGDSIVYMRQANAGLSAARNKGMSVAQGEYLLFLDADDFLDPHAVESHLRAASRHPGCAVYVCGWRNVDVEGKFIAEYAPPALGEDAASVLLKCNIAPPVCMFIRSDVAKSFSGFDVSLRSHEDWDYWLMLVEASYRFGVTPECAANYRIVPGSMSTNMLRMYDTAIAVLKKRRTMQSHCQNCKDSWGEGHKHYARLLIYDYLCRSYLDRGVLSACRSMLAVLKRCTSSFNLCKQMVTYISNYIRSVGRGVCLKMPFIWRIAR